MDILFESSYIKDYKWSREVFVAIRRRFLIISSALVLIYQAIVVYNIANGKIQVPAIIMAALLLFVYAYVIVKSIRLPIKADIGRYGKPVSIRVCATDEKLISYKSSGDIVELEYTGIKRMKQSKNYLYLVSDAGLWYCVRKDGFTVGDYNSFVEFLEAKGIKK